LEHDLLSLKRQQMIAFERMIAAAPSRESRAMSVNQTNASIPSVAPTP
jgi:hypothetical protein